MQRKPSPYYVFKKRKEKEKRWNQYTMAFYSRSVLKNKLPVFQILKVKNISEKKATDCLIFKQERCHLNLGISRNY